MSSRSGKCGHEMELRERACGSDRGAAQAREIVAVRMSNAFDQAEDAQALQLARQVRGADTLNKGPQIGAAHAVDIELGALKRAQQLLLGALEEIQPLDRAIALVLRRGQTRQFARAASWDGGCMPPTI